MICTIYYVGLYLFVCCCCDLLLLNLVNYYAVDAVGEFGFWIMECARKGKSSEYDQDIFIGKQILHDPVMVFNNFQSYCTVD